MVSKNTNYKRNLERYKKFLEGTSVGQEVGYQFLEHPSTAKRKADLVYQIMEGSYRNQSGTGGARTFRGKRVDTYEGRIAAVVDLLGLDNSRYFTSLEKLISTNVYLNTTKSKNAVNEGVFRSEVVGNYVRGLKEGAIKVEKKLEPQVQDLTKKLATSNDLLNVVTKHRDELDIANRSRMNIAKSLEEEKNKSTQAYREALGYAIESRNNRFLRNLFATGLAASLLVSALNFGCSKDKKISSVQPTNKVVSQVRGSFPASVLYPKLANPKDSLCYTGTKKVSSNLDGGLTPEQLRKFYDETPLAMPNYSEKEIETETAVTLPKLGKIVTNGKVSWHEIPEEQRTTRLYYETAKAEPVKEEVKVVQSETNKVVDAQIKPIGTNGLYRMHVDLRNFNSRDSDGDSLDDKVSMNPVYTGRALKNEFVSLGEGISDGKNLGYTGGKTSSRLKSLKDAFKLGFTKENKEARKQYNPLLRTIMATYDGAQSIAKGAVDGADLVLGGLTDKVVYDVIGGGAKTLVNSTVAVGNEAFAVPLDASQRFENWAFKNKGKISMETYELASTIMRFGGNVVLHEASFDGKFVEVRNENGEKVLINKGETGATLESLMAILLDAGVLSRVHSGGNGGSSEGGSWNWNSSGSPGGDVGSFGSSGAGGGI